MAKIRLDVEVPDGQHLGFSRDTDGAYRGHLFDDETNDLVGHAELFEPNEDDADSLNSQFVYVSISEATKDQELTAEEIAQALDALLRLGILVTVLAVETAPHVKRWLHDIAIPAMKSTSDNVRQSVKSTWNRFTRARVTDRGTAPAGMISTTEPVRAESSTELEIAFEDYRARMSSTEARERFVVALLAKAFSEEQMRMLRNANFEDDDDERGLKAVVEALTPQQVGETLTTILEKNPSLLDRGSLAELGTVLGGSQADGEYMSLRIERLKSLPRLRDGQIGT